MHARLSIAAGVSGRWCNTPSEKMKSKYPSENGRVSGLHSTNDTLDARTLRFATLSASGLASAATSSPTRGATTTSHLPLPHPMSNALLGLVFQSMSEKYFAKSNSRSAALKASWVNLPHSLPKPSTVAASRFSGFTIFYSDPPYCTQTKEGRWQQMSLEHSQTLLTDNPGVLFCFYWRYLKSRS